MPDSFTEKWAEAAATTLGFFWMALWAFCLGYVISSMIQVFVTRKRMRESMGETGPRSVALGTFFGFISSSCSFAALSTSRALFQKGAGLVPALAFLLASTNLVIELGILIYIFLSWQFVVAEYVGAVILILVMWAIVRLTLSQALEKSAREHAKQAASGEEEDVPDWRQLIRSIDGWRRVARRYFMEWGMVWKDVVFGFTIAGVIAAFVPPEFFQSLFVGSGEDGGPIWWQTVLQTLIGPLAAFFTFIGSMGNIPLAAILFSSGVSFAGAIAFIFSDLVVFPVLRISSQYFGWKMAVYILGVFLVCLVIASLVLHYGFAALGLLPDPQSVNAAQTQPAERFKIDYTFFLNVGFLAASGALAWLASTAESNDNHDNGSRRLTDPLFLLAISSLLWLAGGTILWLSR